jgi:hypothetical protein
MGVIASVQTVHARVDEGLRKAGELVCATSSERFDLHVYEEIVEMKLKLTVFAAGVAAVFAGDASATIATSASGDGEFFLTAFFAGAAADGSQDRTYVRDIGNGLASGSGGTYSINQAANQANPPALSALFTTAQAGPIIQSNADANWGSFVAGLSGADVASIKYFVVAADSTGSPAGNKRYAVSVNGAAPNVLNQNLSNVWTGNVDTFLANTNLLTGHGTTVDVDGSSMFVGTGATNAFSLVTNGLGGQSPVIAGAIGSQLDAWLYYNSGTSGTAAAGKKQFADLAGTNAFWQLAGANGLDLSGVHYASGTLIYAIPVPEPGTWAMLAAGLVAVGGIARRRISA